MAYRTYDATDLSEFTGRPLASFPPSFVNSSAIPQAVLLFKIGTCIVDPAALSADDQQLVDFAIISMADAIHLTAPYQKALASPFNSETIGSYSYSKTAKAVQKGQETGVMWFDMAIQRLSQCDEVSGIFLGGGIEVFENDGVFTTGHFSQNFAYLTPAEVHDSIAFSQDPFYRIGV